MQDWGNRLQQAISSRNINKSIALAAEMGVDESTVSRWKNGGSISLGKAIRLCDVLNVSMDWLFADRGSIDSREVPEPGPGKDPVYRKLDALPPEAVNALALFLDSVSVVGPDDLQPPKRR